MEKLAELKEKLKELSPEELEELKAFIAEGEKTEETAETEKTEEAAPTEEPKAEEKVADESSAAAEESAAPETAPEKEPAEETAETTEETKAEETPAEEPKGENEGTETAQQEPAPTTPDEDDDIPAMQKIAPTGGDDAVDEGSITAETGETIPVDYEQIIEGLNAKIAALTAENASLKNKVDGAFGYSAKTTMPAKVNRLYDECEDVHIHK